jgi:CTP:phosphocholine cytidylyltransferase-like protein
MQAIILAAGLGKRMGDLAAEKPKALLALGGKPLLEHVLESLQAGGVKNAIIVIGKHGSQVRDYFGNKYQKMALTYVDQREQMGTAHALAAAKHWAQNEFLVAHCDVLAPATTWEKLSKTKGFGCVMTLRRTAHAEKYGVKVTYLPFIMKALIATCREFPMFNASMDDAAAEIVYKKYFNVGFAADTPSGLMVPVIKNADFKTVLQISQEIHQLALKARDGKLSLEDMKGATITITNIGSVGGLYATPIINHPEVAILGMYKIQTKPVWDGKAFVPGQFMNFSITCDHRLIDGAVAANFMKAFVARIENPSQLMLDMI